MLLALHVACCVANVSPQACRSRPVRDHAQHTCCHSRTLTDDGTLCIRGGGGLFGLHCASCSGCSSQNALHNQCMTCCLGPHLAVCISPIHACLLVPSGVATAPCTLSKPQQSAPLQATDTGLPDLVQQT